LKDFSILTFTLTAMFPLTVFIDQCCVVPRIEVYRLIAPSVSAFLHQRGVNTRSEGCFPCPCLQPRNTCCNAIAIYIFASALV
jgi:hypothetical protein